MVDLTNQDDDIVRNNPSSSEPTIEWVSGQNELSSEQNPPAETFSPAHETVSSPSETPSSSEFSQPSVSPEAPSVMPSSPVVSPPAPPSEVPPSNPPSSEHHPNRTFMMIGIIFLLVAGIGIGSVAISTYLSKATKPSDNYTSPSPMPTNSASQITMTNPAEYISEVLFTSEDPTRKGVPVERKSIFKSTDPTIYATAVLKKGSSVSDISYVRYLNSKYVDHGMVKLTDPDNLYVHFLYTLASEKSKHPLGVYTLKIYVNGMLAGTKEYTVAN